MTLIANVLLTLSFNYYNSNMSLIIIIKILFIYFFLIKCIVYAAETKI